MRFKLTKREGHVVHINFRGEKHGDERVPAADVKIRYAITKRDLDMLMPLQLDAKMSDVIYDDKGNLQTPYLSPISIYRKPENVLFCIWDKPNAEKDYLEFDGTTIKNIEVELNDKRNMFCTCSVQIHDDPERDTARLRRLLDEKRQFSLEAQQEELFDKDPEEQAAEQAAEAGAGDKKKKARKPKQTSIVEDEGEED